MNGDRCEAVESNGRVARRVGASAEEVEAFTFTQVRWHAIEVLFVHDVVAVAGGTSKNDFAPILTRFMFAVGKEDRILDRFSFCFREPAETSDVGERPAFLGIERLLRDHHDFGHEYAAIGDKAATRLRDDVEFHVREVLLDVAHDGIAIHLRGLQRVEQLRREAAARVDTLEFDAVFLEAIEEMLHFDEWRIPFPGVPLLAAHME